MYGAKIVEMDVKHHARVYGESKYGIGRTFKSCKWFTFLMPIYAKVLNLTLCQPYLEELGVALLFGQGI